MRSLGVPSLLLVGAVAVGCARSAPKAEPTQAPDAFRAAPPSAGPSPALHAPVPEKHVLANGLTVLLFNKPELPLVSARVVIKSGSAADPRGREGLAGFFGEMLKSGTPTRSAKAIADEIETLGATLSVGVEPDAMSLGATTLSENFPAVFDVIADVVLHSSFPKDEIERVRRQRLVSLAQERDEPEAAADRVFAKTVYGEHPYGHPVLGNEAPLKAIGRGDLVEFFSRHFRPGNAAVVLVGALRPEDALAAAQKRFGAWRAAGRAEPAPKDPSEAPPKVVLVERPGAPQSTLAIGELGVARSTPDYYALVICNAIFGGLFNSRINMSLRENKGFTYGANSWFDFRRARGSFVVSTAVRTDVTADAIREIIKEVEGMRAADVSAEELANAKARYSLSLPGYFQSVNAIAGRIENLFIYDLPLDYYQTLPERIREVTAADVRRVAGQYLRPDRLSIIVVGDRARVLGELERLGRGTPETAGAAP